MKENELQAWEATYGYSMWAMRSLFLTNAGAVAIILTLSGTIWSNETDFAISLLNNVLYFELGIISSLLVAMFAYFTQINYSNAWAENVKFNDLNTNYLDKHKEIHDFKETPFNMNPVEFKKIAEELDEMYGTLQESLRHINKHNQKGELLFRCSVVCFALGLEFFIIGLIKTHWTLIGYIS